LNTVLDLAQRMSKLEEEIEELKTPATREA
jgi:hypothetical protein